MKMRKKREKDLSIDDTTRINQCFSAYFLFKYCSIMYVHAFVFFFIGQLLWWICVMTAVTIPIYICSLDDVLNGSHVDMIYSCLMTYIYCHTSTNTILFNFYFFFCLIFKTDWKFSIFILSKWNIQFNSIKFYKYKRI